VLCLYALWYSAAQVGHVIFIVHILILIDVGNLKFYHLGQADYVLGSVFLEATSYSLNAVSSVIINLLLFIVIIMQQ